MCDFEAAGSRAHLIGILAKLIDGDALNGIGREPTKAPGNAGGALRAWFRSPMAAGTLLRGEIDLRQFSRASEESTQ
jgi:hypothetical protein